MKHPAAVLVGALVVLYLVVGVVLAFNDSNHLYAGQLVAPNDSGSWPPYGEALVVVAWLPAVISASSKG